MARHHAEVQIHDAITVIGVELRGTAVGKGKRRIEEAVRWISRHIGDHVHTN